MDIQNNITQIKETHKMIQEIKNFPGIPTQKQDNKDKTHYIAVTGIIRNSQGKYLICKRAPTEKVFPNKWCVPGGKVQVQDFINTPKDTNDHWFNIFEKVLRKEIKEETNLTIKNIGYISNLALIRPNGYSTIIISLHADHDQGKVTLDKNELTDHAWVTLGEAKTYDLIENIWEQIEKFDNKTIV